MTSDAAATPTLTTTTLHRPVEEVSEPDLGATYDRYLQLMMWIAVRRFRIPRAEAEPLVHEVFANFFSKASTIVDVRAWLVAGISNASRYYLRVRERTEALPADIDQRPDPTLEHVLDLWPDQITARDALAATTARCQLVLRLRYFEGYSVPEIAAELQITTTYATKLVAECIRQMQRRYGKKRRAVDGALR